jgi:hypothetical protein
MKLLGDKNQKAPSRAIQPDRLRDIKTEVGEDTKALLRDAAISQKKATKKDVVKQISLAEVDVKEEEKPNEAPAPQPEKESDLSDFQIIKVKKLPDMNYMIEVKAFEELQKVGKASKFINCYEDGGQKTYFVSNYFYTLDKKRQ